MSERSVCSIIGNVPKCYSIQSAGRSSYADIVKAKNTRSSKTFVPKTFGLSIVLGNDEEPQIQFCNFADSKFVRNFNNIGVPDQEHQFSMLDRLKIVLPTGVATPLPSTQVLVPKSNISNPVCSFSGATTTGSEIGAPKLKFLPKKNHRFAITDKLLTAISADIYS
jgi:hypothetical protein